MKQAQPYRGFALVGHPLDNRPVAPYASDYVWLTALVIAAALMIWPLWGSGPPAMPDYPAHLASYYILDGTAQAGSLSDFYHVDWALIPDVAGEAIVPVLAKIMSLQAAAKFFVSISVVLWVAGPALIHRVLFGRIGPEPLVASLFAYNSNLMWGFVNYYFSMGLAFVVFAAWIAGGAWRRMHRLAFFSVAVTLLYFCHIAAVAALVLLMAAYEWTRTYDRASKLDSQGHTRLVDVGLVCIPIMVLYFMKPGASAGSGVMFNLLHTLPERIAGMIEHGFHNRAFFVLLVVVALTVYGALRGKLAVDRRMRFALAAIAAAALLAPEAAMGGWGLHLRYPAVAASLLFASSEIHLGVRAMTGLSVTVSAALLWMSVSQAQENAFFDRQVAAFRAAMAKLPRGSRLMTAVDPSAKKWIERPLYWHVESYAIIDRGGMASLMFSIPGQHVVRVKPAFAPYVSQTANEGTPPDLGELWALASGEALSLRSHKATHRYLLNFPCHYDEVALIHGKEKPRGVPDFLKLRYQGTVLSLYDIDRSSVCPNGSPDSHA